MTRAVGGNGPVTTPKGRLPASGRSPFHQDIGEYNPTATLENMVFYQKGLQVRKTLLFFVACDRKAAILRVQIWPAHESDVVGIILTVKTFLSVLAIED